MGKTSERRNQRVMRLERRHFRTHLEGGSSGNSWISLIFQSARLDRIAPFFVKVVVGRIRESYGKPQLHLEAQSAKARMLKFPASSALKSEATPASKRDVTSSLIDT